MLALAPIRARLDNGRLKITALQEDLQEDVRVVAQTAVLGLPVDAILGYQISFDHVTYAQKDQHLPSFCVAAPTSDIILDLAVAPRISRR